MEKRRRARINQSLNELKNLILEAMKKDVSQKMSLKTPIEKQVFLSPKNNKTRFIEMSLIKALDIIFQAQATIVSNANGPGPDVV